MSRPQPDPRGELRAAVVSCLRSIEGTEGVGEISFERPPQASFGDYSTNAALLTAPILGSNPRAVAERLGGLIGERLGDRLDRTEVAGPGFLNLFVSDSWLRETAGAVATADRFAAGFAADRARRILVEFVSANPTGPLTVASGRHAAYGDSLARVLDYAGHEVAREYYLNDTGGQVEQFGRSIAARMNGEPVPAGGYEGEYVAELAAELAAEGAGGDDPQALAVAGGERMRQRISDSLERFRVHHDRWASERALRASGGLERALERVEQGSLGYRSDGARWLRTSVLGDDKDRVVVRESGEPTYFASDIAYHLDKLDRGFELLIDVLGADHHGYVPRLRAAVAALGMELEVLEAPIIQLVNLVEGGRRVQMSKRKGEFATLDDLVDDIGVDSARFFLVGRSHETEMDLDLDLARSSERDNPVHYVGYVHARIQSLFRKAASSGGVGSEPVSRDHPVEPAERALICDLAEFPVLLERAELRREPHLIGAYARDLAAGFHAFYRDCRVVGEGEGLEGARLEVCAATRAVIATSLELLGIEAPEEM
ncbi:MAG: arginine--tRNA ligase [Solirubrobacterales bacterium]